MRLAAAGAASGAVGVGAYARYDEGTARSVTFWYHAFPVWAQYRAVQWRNRDLAKIGVPSWTGLTLGDADADAAYERLHERHALKVRDLVFDMRGFYFKNAQLLSTRDDFVPRQYLEWCKLTQDQAPAEMAPGQAEAIARAKLAEAGHPDAFEWWEEEPCGVASIGQVHRARLARRYGGKDVVVKVQAPGIERKFRSDIRTCIDFCRLAMPQHVPPLEEIERQFLTEFDYREEAKNLEEVRRNVMPRWSKKVEIPAPVRQLCTREVLVMDAIPGVKLVDGIRARFRAARGVARRGPGGAREGSKGENRRRGVAAEVGASGGGGDEARQPRAPPGRLAVAATDRVPDRRAVRPEPVVGERRRGDPDHARRPRRRDFQPRRLQRRSSPGQHTPDARRSTGTDRLRSGEAREQGREGGVRQAHAGDISRGQGRGGEVAEVRAPPRGSEARAETTTSTSRTGCASSGTTGTPRTSPEV